MDERPGGRPRRRKLWVGLGTVAVVFLCLAVSGAAALFLGPLRLAGGHWIQHGIRPPLLGHFGGWWLLGISIALRLLFFGLLLLSLILLLRFLLWGRHRTDTRAWEGGSRGTGECVGSRDDWSSQTWHKHAGHWGPPPRWTSPPSTGVDHETEARESGRSAEGEESNAPDAG